MWPQTVCRFVPVLGGTGGQEVYFLDAKGQRVDIEDRAAVYPRHPSPAIYFRAKPRHTPLRS